MKTVITNPSNIELMTAIPTKQIGINLTETITADELDRQFDQLTQSQGIRLAVESLATASLRVVNRNDPQLVVRLLSAKCFSLDNVGGLTTYLRFKCGKSIEIEQSDPAAQNSDKTGDKWLNLLKAEKLMKTKQIIEALAIFKLDVSNKGGIFESQHAVAFANALIGSNKHHWAQRILDVALANGGDRAYILHNKGLAARARGNRLLAATSFLDAVEEDITFTPAYFALQFALDKLDKLWDRATLLLKKAYDSEDKRIRKVPVVSTLHRVYELRGDITSATILNRAFVEQTSIKKVGETIALPKKEPSLDFIIVGASKCGTSSLFSWLGQHPKSILPHTKEINFFNGEHYAYGIDWYLSHFAPLCDKGDYFTGEASPAYFGQTNISSERIRQCLTSVKIIILLRNPADRTLSSYHHGIKVGRIKQPRRETIKLWCEQYRDEQNNDVTVSVYAPRVQKWFSVFDRDNCLIINADELFNKPSSVMPSIFEFLQVEPVTMSYGVVNTGNYQKDEQFEQERQELLQFFEPSIRELEQLLGYDMCWLT